MSISRRGFLGACLAAAVAPAVVKASSLMTVRPIGLIVPKDLGLVTPTYEGGPHVVSVHDSYYSPWNTGIWMENYAQYAQVQAQILDLERYAHAHTRIERPDYYSSAARERKAIQAAWANGRYASAGLIHHRETR